MSKEEIVEEIRFISESCKVKDIPEGSGRLFTIFDDETHLSHIASKLEIVLPKEEDKIIPVGISIFYVHEYFCTIVNIKGEGMQCFPENEHV